MTDLIEFLIGTPLPEFSNGTFSVSWTIPWILVGVIVTIGGVWLLYAKTTIAITGRLKITLIAVRSMILLLIFLALLQPVLTTSKIIPQESYLALLTDDSQSMAIPDMENKQTRGSVLHELIHDQSPFIQSLRENFRIRTFGFSETTYRLVNTNTLTFQGQRTAIAQGLKQVNEALTGFPLSGIVLLSDGGNNNGQDPTLEANHLRSLNIPIFTVGFGEETIKNDIEIVQIRSNKTVIEGALFEVNAMIRHHGYDGQTVELTIENEGKDLVTQSVTLGKSNTTQQYTMELAPDKSGLQIYNLHVSEQNDELITANNHQSFLIDNRQKTVRLLYMEGHPRHEYKFIQRALKQDESIQLATYLQTAPQKFLRQGIASPQELASGFPASKAALYQYEAIILGDVNKSFFTEEQLVLLKQYVDERGGGLLMIGGTTAFEDGFIGTSIADLLPITLVHDSQIPLDLQQGTRQGMSLVGETFRLLLTPEGKQSPILRLGFEGEMNEKLWDTIPALQSINVTERVKPGATLLAVHPTLRFKESPLPVIAHQRFGQGRTMAITTASTWRWQMLMPSDDTTHERFWRQIARWLTTQSPQPLEIKLTQESYHVGDTVTIRTKVLDKTYAPVNDATVWLKITNPDGTIQDLQLKWDIEQPGVYQGELIVHQEGIFQLEASSTTPSRDIHEASTGILVTTSNLEYTRAHMDSEQLKRIAQASGGKFYTIDDVDQLLEDVKSLSNDYSVETQKSLWDMPLTLLVLLAFFGVEWFIRRQKGMS